MQTRALILQTKKQASKNYINSAQPTSNGIFKSHFRVLDKEAITYILSFRIGLGSIWYL